MKKIHFIAFFAAMTCLASCNQTSQEAKAEVLLQESRQLLTEGRYDAARNNIMNLRKQYPTAIQARAQALLLLDSVEMAATIDSIGRATGEEWKRLSVKKQFYERKLQEDKKKLGL